MIRWRWLGDSASSRVASATTLSAAPAAAGLSNKQVAAQLYLSVYTVEAYLSAAYAKLGIRSRAELDRKSVGTYFHFEMGVAQSSRRKPALRRRFLSILVVCQEAKAGETKQAFSARTALR